MQSCHAHSFSQSVIKPITCNSYKWYIRRHDTQPKTNHHKSDDSNVIQKRRYLSFKIPLMVINYANLLFFISHGSTCIIYEDSVRLLHHSTSHHNQISRKRWSEVKNLELKPSRECITIPSSSRTNKRQNVKHSSWKTCFFCLFFRKKKLYK